MPVQLKETKKSKQAEPTAGPSADDRVSTPVGGPSIEGRLVSVVGDRNGRPRIMIAVGSDGGVKVGMFAYIKDGADGRLGSFQIDEVQEYRSFATVNVPREQLRANAFVVINPAPTKGAAKAGPRKARIIGANVAGPYVEITIGNGREQGAFDGMRGHLVAADGTLGREFTVTYVDGRLSRAYLDRTTVDEVRQFPEVQFGDTKRTPVQRRASGAVSTANVDATAQAGVAGASSRLPFFDTIQRSFGKHDISGVQAQIGGPAADASRALGAQAYATGNKVAFASAPDLHTAAHEAAHTVQQQRGAVGFQGLGAADDEHERHADAVADAVVAGGSAEALLDSVGGSAGVGAIQRKPETWWSQFDQPIPENPKLRPMSGKDADRYISTVPEVWDYIQPNITRGITGERVKFYSDFEAYVDAWYNHSLEVNSFFNDKLTPEQIESTRWRTARAKAKQAPGFTNTNDHVAHIYTKGTPPYVTIHELMHVHTHPEATGLPKAFIEGCAEHFAVLVCQRNGLPFVTAYAAERAAMDRLATEVGEERLARLLFHGRIEEVAKAVDSKRFGLWREYVKALKLEDYAMARQLLTGVKHANEGRELVESTLAELSLYAKAPQESASSKKWPPEGTRSIRARAIGVQHHSGHPIVIVAAGGQRGVREGWTATLALADGRTVTGTVVRVDDRRSDLRMNAGPIPTTIEELIELKPARK